MTSFGRKARQEQSQRRQMPDAVISLSGPWNGGLTRQEKSALGMHTVYWVLFDEPQFDADGDGPYRGGQIWESALSLLTDRPN